MPGMTPRATSCCALFLRAAQFCRDVTDPKDGIRGGRRAVVWPRHNNNNMGATEGNVNACRPVTHSCASIYRDAFTPLVWQSQMWFRRWCGKDAYGNFIFDTAREAIQGACEGRPVR